MELTAMYVKTCLIQIKFWIWDNCNNSDISIAKARERHSNFSVSELYELDKHFKLIWTVSVMSWYYVCMTNGNLFKVAYVTGKQAAVELYRAREP
jgi:hypothetical protein